MNLQYISDSKGNTTGVPDWHKEIVIKRIEDFYQDKAKAIDFEQAMDEIENEL